MGASEVRFLPNLNLSRPFVTGRRLPLNPALERWATVIRPFGTKDLPHALGCNPVIRGPRRGRIGDGTFQRRDR